MLDALLRLLRLRDGWCPVCRDVPTGGGFCSDECAQQWRDDYAY